MCHEAELCDLRSPRAGAREPRRGDPKPRVARRTQSRLRPPRPPTRSSTILSRAPRRTACAQPRSVHLRNATGRTNQNPSLLVARRVPRRPHQSWSAPTSPVDRSRDRSGRDGSGQWCAELRGDESDRGGSEQRQDDAATERRGGRSRRRRAPRTARPRSSAQRERDGRRRRWRRSRRARRRRGTHARSGSCGAGRSGVAPRSTNTNDGVNATSAASRPPPMPARGVADDGDGLHDRPGGDLTERDRVEELRVGHPVVVVDGVGLHQRDDDEAAAVRERADLQRDPRRARAGRRSRRCAVAASSGPEVRAERPGAADAWCDDLDEAAAEQHEHEPGADGRGGDRAEHARRAPSASVRRGARASSAGSGSVPGAHRDRGDRRAGARAGAEHPRRAASRRGTARRGRGSATSPGG